MSQYRYDLGAIIGRVRNVRPNVGDQLVKDWINDRVRQVLDARTIWADLVKPGIVSIPAEYTTGTISVTNASNVVTGSATAWPINDVVATTLSTAIEDIGYVETTPASMTGITEDSVLLIDSGANAEAVSVVQKGTSTFWAQYTKAHAAGVAITQSSLANRQLRISTSYPIFTVQAVVSATSMWLTLPWGGEALSAQTYRIVHMYLVLATDLKGIIAMKDESTGYPVNLHVPIEEANYRDPQRTYSGGNPYYNLIDLGPNNQGNMQYELWPASTEARQFSFLYYRQWPEMTAEGDRPPWFINPSVFIDGAIADALRYRQGPKDPYHDPNLANEYEKKFVVAFEQAKNADESKRLQALLQPYWKGRHPGSVDQWQYNDPAWASFEGFGSPLF